MRKIKTRKDIQKPKPATCRPNIELQTVQVSKKSNYAMYLFIASPVGRFGEF